MPGHGRRKANGARAGGPTADSAASAARDNSDRIAQMEASAEGTVRDKATESASPYSWLGSALDVFKSQAAAIPGGEPKTDAKAPKPLGVGADKDGAWAAFSSMFNSGNGSLDARAGLKDGAAHLGGSVASKKGSLGAGVGIKKDNIAASLGGESVAKRGKDGEVLDGKSRAVAVGPKGMTASMNSTKNGNSRGATATVNDGGLGLGFNMMQASGFGVNGSFLVGDGQIGGGAGLSLQKGAWGVSGSVSTTVTNDKGVAGLSTPGAGGAAGDAARMFGVPAASFGLKDGVSANGSVGANAGPVSLSLSGYLAESQTTQFHTTAAALLEDYDAETMIELAEDLQGMGQGFSWTGGGPFVKDTDALASMDEAGLEKLSKKHPKLYLAYMEKKFTAKVEQARSFDALDIDGLQAGEAYSYESGSASGIKGRAGVYGIGVSLGSSSQNIERLSVGKDTEGRTQIKMTSMDEDALSAGLDFAGAIEIGGVSKKGNMSSVEFSVDNTEQGKRALAEFQATGLLPGAKAALDGDRESASLFADLEKSKTRMRAVDYMGGLFGDEMTVDNPAYAPTQQWGQADAGDSRKRISIVERREQMRAEIAEKSGAINQAMLDRRKWDLSTVQVPGITYTSHRIMDSESQMKALSLLGWEVMKWGSSFAEWEEHYQSKDQDETEYGGKKDTKYVFADDERTHLVMNPRNGTYAGKEIELAMFVKQGMSKRERGILGKLPNGAGMRPEQMEAWSSGRFTDGGQTQVSVAMTEGQLGFMGENFGVGDDFWGHAAQQTEVHRQAASHSQNKNGTGDMLRDMEKERSGGFSETFVGAEVDRRRDLGEGWWDAVHSQNDMHQNIANVTSAEDFKALSENEQGIAIASYVMRGVDDKNIDPWDAAHMVLAIDDREVRDRHMRTLFMTYEHASEETTAAVDFIEWVQVEAESAGLEKGQTDMLLSGVRVDIMDGRVNKEAKQIVGKGVSDPKTAAWVAGKLMGEASDLALSDFERERQSNQQWGPQVMRDQANEAGDWLQAADKAGGGKLVNEVMKQATKKDPEFVANYLSNMAKTDRTRARILADILADTPDFKDQANQFLGTVQRTWVDQILFDAGVPLPGSTD